MKIGIIGAGGMGGFLGVKLAEAGHDIYFVARGKHLEAMTEKGLTLREESGETTVTNFTAAADPAGFGEMDLIIFGVKLYDTMEAAKLCLPMMGPGTVILTLQNGVESVDMISEVVGDNRTIAGSIYVSANIEEPGVIRHNGGANMMMYAGPAGMEETQYNKIATVIRDSAMAGDRHPDMMVMLWEKFVLLAANAGLGAVTGLDAGTLCRDPDSRPLFEMALREAEAVANASGVTLQEGLVPMFMARVDELGGQKLLASQAYAKLHGNKLEVEWIQGTIHRLGQKYGVPTPVHSLCYVCLKPFANGA
ncbi:ketopantoate reductase family protein [Emcibacter nanhaiensis]|uniref:2-dehydropantoate 2-reductase n=1 Tax=Emcibacter nanhaiensis TaxID=1505037 RepID=A0A501PSE4_9PROT|nr:2-dehydropantoate 2-reductase [Emcibacter nanhaiensis]TPD62982.1 2-dehydropantoate 2-reductase [Emcibacter nanhaiensis]